MKINKETLYELSPKEFERLCAEILTTKGLDSVKLVGGPEDQGIDILAMSNKNVIGVQVKHARDIPVNLLKRTIDEVAKSSHKINELYFMTSTSWKPRYKKVMEESNVPFSIKFIDRNEILKDLEDKPGLIDNFFTEILKRLKSQKRLFLVGFLASMISIFGMFLPFSEYISSEKDPLVNRIDTVELAIKNLKGLEEYLINIKEDMIETERATKKIESEYAKAKELEKLTEAQFEALRSGLHTKTSLATALNYILGFILGVGSSVVGSFIYSRMKQRKALS